MSAPALFPAGHASLCDSGHRCPRAVVEHEGRYYVTFGHCGFTANNGRGYATADAARGAIQRHQRPTFTARIEASR